MPADTQIRADSLALCPAPEAAIERPSEMDPAAFRVFYERTARPLWAYLARVSGSRDLADDLVQESYCRLLSTRLPVMSESECKSYLFRIASNLMRDYWRRNRSEATEETVEPSHDEDIDTRVELRRAYEELNPRERQLLWLAYVEGSDHREIASVTGLRAGSIRVLLSRARQRLAGLLRSVAAENDSKKVKL